MSSVLRRHLWLIGASVVVAVAVAAWLSRRQVPEHRAEAVIRIGAADVPAAEGIDPLLSEMVVLTGRTVVGQAVDSAGLRLFSRATGEPAGFVENAAISLPPSRSATIGLEFLAQGVEYGTASDRRTAGWGEPVQLEGARFAIPGPPAGDAADLAVVPRDDAIDYLVARLAAEPDTATGMVRVLLTAGEPRIAVRAVNAIVEAYRAASAEAARQEIGRRRAFLERELRAADSLLVLARGESEIEEAREVEALEQARQQADVLLYEGILDRIVEMRRSGQAVDPSSLMSLPGVAGDPAVRQLYSRLVGYRLERERLLSGPEARSPQHPDVLRLNSLMASTEESLIQSARRRLGILRAQAAPPPPAIRDTMLATIDPPEPVAGDFYLPRNLEALEETAARLREEYREARLAEASETGPAEIVQPATQAQAVAPRRWLTLLVGLAAGLALGGAAAATRELLDPTHRRRRMPARRPAPLPETAGEAAEGEAAAIEHAAEPAAEPGADAVPVPTLGVIPEVVPSLAEPSPNGDFRPGPLQAAGVEAYNTLRANLVAARWGLKTLVVTSAHPGEGKTTTSTNLAATYARQGRKVVLVECDLRRPSLGRYFGISKDVDLMDVLFRDQDWRDAIQLTRMPGLYVLLGEKTFPRAGESLGGEEMKRLLAELSAEYDMVILDTSPLLVAADAVSLGPIVDGVVLVVRSTRTDRATVEEIVGRLREAGANVLGTILNDPEGAGAPA
jgi:capsular exopolysaccharide synthesis family protein